MTEILTDLDSLIRNGLHGEARERLVSLSRQKIARPHVVGLADIARRVNAPAIMVTLLRPIIFDEIPGATRATDREKAFYATALSRLGVYAEAQAILSKIDIDNVPEALLFQGQHYMLQWDDMSAIPKLRKFIESDHAPPYQRLVGQVNLASCLISNAHRGQADKILTEIRSTIEETVEKNDHPSHEFESYRLLYANSLELSAQLEIADGNFKAALNMIVRGRSFLKGSRSRYEMMLKKWNAIIHLLERPTSAKVLSEFQNLKGEALNARNWETVRDFEFYEVLALRDDALFIRLYHGTPHASFRRRIKKMYAPSFSIPKNYDWDVAPENIKSVKATSANEDVRTFDMSRGSELSGRRNLLEFPLLFKLFQILAKDFYRSVSLGSIVSFLYPDEYYNPVSSPEKAIRAVKRLRKWFEENEIPLEIDVNLGHFHIRATGDYKIRTFLQQVVPTKNTAILESVTNQYTNRIFTARDIVEELEISLGAARGFLKWAVLNREVRQIAAGRSARYRLTKTTT